MPLSLPLGFPFIMRLSANQHLFNAARYQRQHQTAISGAVWQALRGRQLGPRFHREKVIGDYIVDFWCPSHLLVVEIHSENFPYPPERETRLLAQGVRQVLCIPSVLTRDEIIQRIRGALMGEKKESQRAGCGHDNSGLTPWGTCWACYSEKHRGERT